jgi:hypothetical protein
MGGGEHHFFAAYCKDLAFHVTADGFVAQGIDDVINFLILD